MLARLRRHRGNQPQMPRLTNSDENTQFGVKYAESEHLSVPELARLLMDELPQQFGLLFSATVYRYEVAAPWIIDINIHGVPLEDTENPERADELAAYVTDWIDQYNFHRPDAARFIGPNVMILREFEPHSTKPGRVTVRRYHLRTPIVRRIARLRAGLAGLLAGVVI